MLLPVEREIVLGTGYKEPLTLLEDLMAQLYPIEIVLRLLALISLANQVRSNSGVAFLLQCSPQYCMGSIKYHKLFCTAHKTLSVHAVN